MDISAFWGTLFSTGNPLLPHPTVLRLALHGVWAIVLGSGALLAAGKLPRPYRLGLVFLVLLWTLMPGSASPAYWLGLAFQTPSLMSTVICLGWAGSVWPFDRIRTNVNKGIGVFSENTLTALKILVAVGVVLGWVLLLDTLAWLPVSVYAWGFSAAAVGAVALCATLLWLVLGSVGSVLPLLVLTLFVLTRLPSGNVWDALLDPWLWVALQLGWFISAVRRRLAARRVSAAIRA